LEKGRKSKSLYQR